MYDGLPVQISAAYAILGDPDKRSTYDDFGDANMEGFGSYWEYQQSQTKASRVRV
jgi:DnaJ-class molecular chaperone